MTPTRLVLVQVLSQKHRLFTIDELVSELYRKYKKKFDWVTVFRNMQTFQKAGLVDETDFGDGLSRFEWHHGVDEHHHHIICRKCKTIKVLPHCELSQIEKKVREQGYKEIQHRLEFFGICKKCKK